MNIYERILNILLEARVEMFIQDRLDEKKLIGKQKKLDVNKSGKLDAQDFKILQPALTKAWNSRLISHISFKR